MRLGLAHIQGPRQNADELVDANAALVLQVDRFEFLFKLVEGVLLPAGGEGLAGAAGEHAHRRPGKSMSNTTDTRSTAWEERRHKKLRQPNRRTPYTLRPDGTRPFPLA